MKIIENKKIFLTIGLSVMLGSLAVVSIFGLKLGIDFTGGSLTEVSYEDKPTQSVIEEAVNSSVSDLGAFSVRQSANNDGGIGYIIRTRDLSEPERESLHAAVTEINEGTIDRFTSIGPVIGEELKNKAVWAIGGVALIIILYVAFAFAGVGKPVGSWVYGGITIFALIHDVLVPAALMSLLGLLLGVEVDVLFVMALLAVLGYSVNDTIVVFDRVRENLIRYRQEKKKKTKDEFGQPKEEIDYVFNKPFSEIVSESVSQTIARSINTSFTTLLALIALYFIGGSVTQIFALILIAGVVAGTYSSIFLAPPLLVYMAERSATKEADQK
ncbi:protein translocase subunit SecF [Candidatus Kaiserbacteria bacterium]|nr:protein translocase subunit SecF [Candidatus Kaiserbacteria bacterium]